MLVNQLRSKSNRPQIIPSGRTRANMNLSAISTLRRDVTKLIMIAI